MTNINLNLRGYDVVPLFHKLCVEIFNAGSSEDLSNLPQKPWRKLQLVKGVVCLDDRIQVIHNFLDVFPTIVCLDVVCFDKFENVRQFGAIGDKDF